MSSNITLNFTVYPPENHQHTRASNVPAMAEVAAIVRYSGTPPVSPFRNQLLHKLRVTDK